MNEKINKLIFGVRSEGISFITFRIYIRVIHFIDNIMIGFFSLFKIKDNYIVLESGSDFSDNAWAFYNYLIKNNYNKTYKLIWFVQKPKIFQNIEVKNVIFVSRTHKGIHLKADFYVAVSKYFVLSHARWLKKWRKTQIVIQTTHSVDALKAATVVKEKVADYVLCCSDNMAQKKKKQFIKSDMLVLGMPRIDLLYQHKDCFFKIFGYPKTKKLILTMETFKQHDLFWKDGDIPNKFALNVISDINQLIKLDQFLGVNGCKMIVKIHHLQDMSYVEAINYEFNNIKYLTDDQLSVYNVQVNQLLENADLLITDYSSVFYEFLLLDRPIGFTIGDIDSYSRGFEHQNIIDYMPGEKIKNFDELLIFIDSFLKGEDSYKIERLKMISSHFKYCDDHNCERLINWIQEH